ncbi:MAG: DUF4159 domain-containing protein [Isosphaeraceae bacterium]
MARNTPQLWPTLLALTILAHVDGRDAQADVTREQVETAIKDGVHFLQTRQARDGSWPGQNGVTSLVTLALLTAGEPVDSPSINAALRHQAQFGPGVLNNTYAVALQTMVFSAAGPVTFRNRIVQNAAWLEAAQAGQRNRRGSPGGGSWSYTAIPPSIGDNSNSQYALLGLNAAREAGVPISREIWMSARDYWERSQSNSGGWAYTLNQRASPSASMTCAGISSLVISGLSLVQGQEELIGETIHHCGRVGVDPSLQRGIDWLAANFRVDTNVGGGAQWKYYYLYGLERAGRLSGQRYFGAHDWYHEGAEEMVREQDRLSGAWNGDVITTSFALLFLSKGRAPVLINKLRHGPGRDWDNDKDDIRNLVDVISKDWGHLLTWQTVDPGTASVEDLLQAPILYFNGHEAPHFGDQAKANLREYVEQGGTIVAEACCDRPRFDQGFRALMEDIFPEPEYQLHPLAEEHAIWRSRHLLSPDVHPLWGIEHGCRTVVVYSPQDLSCFWNHIESHPQNAKVIKSLRVGQNIIDYATGREMPADKLVVREVTRRSTEVPKRGALQIAKLKHAGDWNIAPLAIPNLTNALRAEPLKFDVVINHREISPGDPNLVNFPLIYVHGRAAMSFGADDLEALRRHLEPGGGTLFADAACGSTTFDTAFRAFVAALLPDQALVPIPPDDPLYSTLVGYDLHHVQFSKAAGGKQGPPLLEGVKVRDHWGIIYSKYDLGCALESHQGPDCKGYTHESALKIAANIVIYATLP